MSLLQVSHSSGLQESLSRAIGFSGMPLTTAPTATGIEWRTRTSVVIDRRKLQFIRLIDVKNLGPASKLLGMLLLVADKDGESTYKSIKTISETLQQSRAQVKRYFAKLEKRELLENCGRQCKPNSQTPRGSCTRRLSTKRSEWEKKLYLPLPMWALGRQWGEQLMIAYLAYKAGDRNHCFVYASRLADELGLSEEWIRETLRRLSAQGLIHQLPNKAKGKIYLLAPQAVAKVLNHQRGQSLNHDATLVTRNTGTPDPSNHTKPEVLTQQNRNNSGQKLRTEQSNRNPADWSLPSARKEEIGDFENRQPEVIEAIGASKAFRFLYDMPEKYYDLLPVILRSKSYCLSTSHTSSPTDYQIAKVIQDAIRLDEKNEIKNSIHAFFRAWIKREFLHLDQVLYPKENGKCDERQSLREISARINDAIERLQDIDVPCAMCLSNRKAPNRKKADGTWLHHDDLYRPVCERHAASDSYSRYHREQAATAELQRNPNHPATPDALRSAYRDTEREAMMNCTPPEVREKLIIATTVLQKRLSQLLPPPLPPPLPPQVPPQVPPPVPPLVPPPVPPPVPIMDA